ncbi:hypothetical protein QE152_g2034 [Popillia japonica]|uniref:Transposase n=1 Tax=Popillia japonica TaxID=7064 RepID=A0AAW1N4U9_POPJA
MTCDRFTEWYRDDFMSEVKEFRKRRKKTGEVLLIMDNAPFHPIDKPENEESVDTQSTDKDDNLQGITNILPSIPGFSHCDEADTQSTDKDDNLQGITNILPSIPGFSHCDEADVKAWLDNDNDPGYQIMKD